MLQRRMRSAGSNDIGFAWTRGMTLSQPCPTVIPLIPLALLVILSRLNEREIRFETL